MADPHLPTPRLLQSSYESTTAKPSLLFCPIPSVAPTLMSESAICLLEDESGTDLVGMCHPLLPVAASSSKHRCGNEPFSAAAIEPSFRHRWPRWGNTGGQPTPKNRVEAISSIADSCSLIQTSASSRV